MPAAIPDYVARPAAGFYRATNPSTKLAIAALEVVCAFLVPGWLGPGGVLLVVLAVAWAAHVLRKLGVVALTAAPILVSIFVVNLFLLPGASDPIVRLGPLAPTWSGLAFGVLTAVRVLAFSLAIALVYVTTSIDDLLTDLARRGLGRRAIFVVGSAVETVPRTIERAAEIVDAQRARGLDTEGAFWRRARGVVPLAAPIVFSALTEVEERTMALEARGFSAPGRQMALRAVPDSGVDRAVRWLVLLALVAVVVVVATGRLR